MQTVEQERIDFFKKYGVMEPDEEELLKKILDLEGEQKIFIKLNHDLCKEYKYICYKVDGFQNALNSYLNSTTEAANQVNFEKFVDKIAQLIIEKEEIFELLATSVLPEKIYAFLNLEKRTHSYMIEPYMEVMVVEPVDSVGIFTRFCFTHGVHEEHNCATHSSDHEHGVIHNHENKHNHD